MTRHSKAAERARRYRARQRERSQPAVDLTARLEEVRRLARPEAPEHLCRAYVDLTVAFDAEIHGKRRSRTLKELNEAALSLARELGLSPRERRLSGEGSDMVSMADVAASLRNVLRVQRTRWESLKMEIQLFGNKEDLGGQTRTGFLEEIASLRLKAPELFDASELAASPEQLYDRIVSSALARLPGVEEEPS